MNKRYNAGRMAKCRSKQPWFSYLELTTVEEFSELNSAQESAEDRLRSAYNLSVTQADQVINTVLEQLNSLKLMDNTVVVITSNHGTEFNETKTILGVQTPTTVATNCKSLW